MLRPAHRNLGPNQSEMDEAPPTLPPPEGPTPAPKTSLPARLMNVFAIPGDVFDEIKAAPGSIGNWLLPAIISFLVSALAAVILFSQPTVQQQMKERQEEQMQKLVKDGKMSQADADKAMAIAGPTMKILGVTGALFYAFGRVFFWGTVLWLLGRVILRAPFPYLKAAEVAGLAGMIGVLGAIVTLLLQVNLSDPTSSPSLALLVKHFDPTKSFHLVLATFNVFDIWQVVVLTLALARLAGVAFARAAFPMLLCWIVVRGFQLALTALATGFGPH